MPRPEPGAGRVPAPVNRVGQRAARCPEDPTCAPFGGSVPSALVGKRRRLILPRVRLASPCARARQTPAARSSVGSPGVRTPRRLPLPGRSPVPTLTRRLRTSPPTCSLLLTSRAAGTMGWGCHSNQTGRHNPGMCAAPPPCRRASGAAAATLGGLPAGLRLRGAVGGAPGLCGEQAKAAERKGGRDGGVEVWGGGGGRRPPSSRRGRLARRTRPSGSARVKAGTAPGGRGGAHLPSSPRRACGAHWAPRRSCHGCSPRRWRTRTRCQVSGARVRPGPERRGRRDGPGPGPEHGRRGRCGWAGAAQEGRLGCGAALPPSWRRAAKGAGWVSARARREGG